MLRDTPFDTEPREFASAGSSFSRARRERRAGCLAASALVLGASAALAQNAPESPLETVLVTGTRVTAGPDAMPNPTTILTQGELTTTNPVSVPEFLRIVPGVQLTQPGGGAGILSFYMRGCQPNYTLFLVDGVKVTDPNDSRGGSFDLSTLSVGEVDRVEIIRGPQSSIYGADALCGVVNVITRHHYDAWQAQTSGEIGTHDWYDVALGMGGPVMEKGSLVLHAENMDQGSLVDGGTFGLSTFDGKLTLDRGTGWAVIGHGRYSTSHGTSFPDQSGGPEYAVTPDRDRRSTNDWQADLQGLFNLPADWVLNTTASNYHHQADFASPNVCTSLPCPPPGPFPPAIPARGELDDLLRQYASANAVGHIMPGLQATAGVDYTYERGSTDGYLVFGAPLPTSYQLTRADVGLFAELQYVPVTGLTLSGSTRRDDWRQFGTHSTSSLGFVYTPDQGVTEVRFNWGQGFKLPSFWALGNALVGNPNLLPEESRTTELGVSRRFMDRLKLSITAFDNQFYNEVDFENATFKFENVAEVKGRGGEFQFLWDIDAAVSLSGNATYVAIDPGQSNVTIRQRPKWLGNLQGTWRPMEHWSLQTTVRSEGPQLDTSVPAQDPPANPSGIVTLGAYTVVNVSAVWDPSSKLRVTFAVDNLLDKHYSELYGFPEPSIQPRLGAQYRFP
jgi:vitamin B12 transporter